MHACAHGWPWLASPRNQETPVPRCHPAVALAALVLAVPLAHARVTRIVIDETRPLAAAESGGVPTEQVAGRAFGELDAGSPANSLINDLLLARDPDGKVRYVATFV